MGKRGPRAEQDERCDWCRRPLPEPAATGRPRRYCRRSCRQRAFEARRRVAELGWGEDRLRDLTARLDDLAVAVAGLEDLCGELEADLEDGRPWGDGRRVEHAGRLRALTDDLRAVLAQG